MLLRGSRKIFTEGSKFLQARGVSISKEENSRCLVSLHGGNGSPYTRKVMSALRYKQIPFSQHTLMPGNMLGDWEEKGFGHIKPKVIPVIKYDNGQAQNDSTFIFKNLDKLYPTRPILPPDPHDQFLALLLEDMFDEWGTKVMFGMRWLEKIDQDWSGAWLMFDFQLGSGKDLKQLADIGRQFGARQVGRMKIVGCDNKETVLRSMHGLLGPLENHLQNGSLCILGSTPTIADFALYGQLSQLIVDRTPDQIVRDKYPAVWSWVRRFEDLSGLEDSKAHCDNKEYLKEILGFAGKVYLPFLAANRAALAAGEKEVRVKLWADDPEPIEHVQPVFKYQEKCYQRIQDAYQSLPPLYKKRAVETFSGTNCLEYIK